jgi:hypothetical protein
MRASHPLVSTAFTHHFLTKALKAAGIQLTHSLPTPHTALPSISSSDSIPEIGISLQNLLSPISLRILTLEVNPIGNDNHDNDDIASQTAVDTRAIRRSVLGAEDQGARNTADTSKADHSCAAESTLPVPADVVGLICEAAWHTSRASGGDEESSEIACTC